MNSYIINNGIIQIKFYSVLILFAFALGYFLVIKECKKQGIPLTKISDMCFYLIIFSLLGARIYYCLFNIDYYKSNLLDIVKVWEGGLAIHGGIIGGFIYIYIYTKKNKIDLINLLDIFAPALAIGQAIGRWGNFFNSEAYGPITTLETLKKLNIPNFIIDGMYINSNYHHPTFYYESISCLIIFIILIVLRKSIKKHRGKIIGIYLILYGIVRFFIESLRQDSLMFFDFKVAQIVSIIMLVLGILLFINSFKEYKNDK